MKKSLVFSIIMILSFALNCVYAQAPDLTGKKEIGLSGNFNVGKDNASIGTQAFIGYYINDRFEIGPTFGGNFQFVKDGEDSYMSNGGVFLKLHFPSKSKAVPYVGGSGGAFLTKSGDSSDAFGLISGLGGLKVFVSENTSFFAQYDYQRVFATGGSIGYSYGTFGFATLF